MVKSVKTPTKERMVSNWNERTVAGNYKRGANLVQSLPIPARNP